MNFEGKDRPDGSGLLVAFDSHRAQLLRFLAARCGNAQEADDLLQDLWIKTSSQPSGPVGNPRAYLFRMANNLVLDRRRAEQRAMRRDHAWLSEDGGGDDAPEDRPDPEPGADEELARKQEADLLIRAIAQLPPGAQRALRLHRLKGHSQGEVAEIMGISRSGVEKHLVVAMRRLKLSLIDCGLGPAAASSEQGHAGGADPPLEPNRRTRTTTPFSPKR